MITLQKYIYSM